MRLSAIKSRVAITPPQLEAFFCLLRQRLANRYRQVRKAYLRSVIPYIEVGDDRIRIVGETVTLAAAAAGQRNHSKHVRGFVRFEPLTPRFLVWCSTDLIDHSMLERP